MRIDIITVLPELLKSPFEHSILKRAIDKGLAQVNLINLRDYAGDKYRSIDDYMFGGGAGMVMMIEPIANCINDLKSKNNYDEIIYMSPDGELLNQSTSNHLSTKKISLFFAATTKELTSGYANILLLKKFLLEIMF